MKTPFILILLFLPIFSVFSQEEQNDIRFSPLVSLDSRDSFDGTRKVRIRGFRFGAAYGCSHKFGFAFNFLATPTYTFDPSLDPVLNAKSTNTNIYLRYGSIFYEYTWINEKRVEFTTPIQIGIASLNKNYDDVDKGVLTYYNESTMISEFTGVFMYRILPFLWAGGGVGYRYVFTSDVQIQTALNTPYYLLRLKFGRRCRN